MFAKLNSVLSELLVLLRLLNVLLRHLLFTGIG